MPDGYERLNNPTARQAKFLGIGSPGLRSPRRAPPPSRTSPQSAQTGSSPGSPAARQPGSPGQPRSALRRNVTRKQMLDGGEIARLRGAVRGEGSLRIQFGLKMLHDPRLRTILERESFYMNVIDSRILTVHILVRGVLSYFSPVRVAVLLALAGVYVSVALTCAVAGPDTSNGSRTICAADFSSSSASSDLYRPALLNSVAGLLLSFYASAVVGEYKNAYLACQRMKGAVMQLMTIAGAEMGDQGASGLEALIDLWRAVNLVHLATYCLADKRRDIYSFDNFLLPVAEAFGPHDGAQQIGMFRRSELRGLGKEHLISSGAPQAGAASCESGSVGDGCDPRDEDEYDLSATHLQAATHAERADDLMGDVRGNVRSDAALVYQFYSGRMYRVVRDCIKAKLTSMAGPVWGAALAGVRTASEEVQHRALYRMPKVYQMSVQVVLFTTLLVDASIGGAVVGRLWHGPTGARPWWQAGPSPETQSDAVLDVESSSAAAVLMASIATTALLAVLFVPATLLLAVCVELEEPFGDQTMDLPGLSYVRAAAEVSLNFVAPHPVCQAAQYAVMDVDLDFITAEKSTATSPASRATSPSQSQGSPSPGGLNAGAGAPSP